MAMLLFYVGENCYAVDHRDISQVIPNVHLKKMPGGPAYIAGLLNFQGRSILTIDFCQLIEQRSTQAMLHSRIILIQFSQYPDQIWGLLGEYVENILPLTPEQFSLTKFHSSSLPYLDRIYHDDKRMIQYLDVNKFFKFLSTDLEAILKNKRVFTNP